MVETGDSIHLLRTSELLKKDEGQGNALLNGIWDGAISSPARAIQQLGGNAESAGSDSHVSQNSGFQTGKIIGSFVPFIGAAVLTRKISAGAFGELAAPSAARLVGEQAGAGFLLGSVLTPTDLKPGESLFRSRMEQGGVSAATFATMSGFGLGLERALPKFGESALANISRKASIGFLAGSTGGLVDAEARSGFKASGEDLINSAIGYGVFGSMMEGTGLALKGFKKDLPSVKITDQSFDTTRALAADPQIKPGAVRLEPTPADFQKHRDTLIDSLSKVSAEVANAGEKPGDAIANALRRDRVVMVGEYHVEDSAHRELGAQIMPQLKNAGLTHLAIEHSSDFNGKIFKADGAVDIPSLPEGLRHYEFIQMLSSAKRNGIEVVPVDAPLNAPRDLELRNQFMDKNISSILAESSKNRVLYWVGNHHLQMIDAANDGPQVAQLLREKGVPVTTFYGQHDNFYREEPLRNYFTPDSAVAVPMSKAPVLGNLSWAYPDQVGFGVNKYSEFDYMLLYPKQRPRHWD